MRYFGSWAKTAEAAAAYSAALEKAKASLKECEDQVEAKEERIKKLNRQWR
eukprot:gene683-4998_t